MRATITEANATIDQLRDVAVILTDLILGSIEARGRNVGPDLRQDNFRKRDAIVSSLKNLGVTDAKIDEALHSFNEDVKIDLLYEFYVGLLKQQSSPIETATVNSCFIDRDSYLFGNMPLSSITDCLNEHDISSPQSDAALADLTYFTENKQLRRPEVYFRKGH